MLLLNILKSSNRSDQSTNPTVEEGKHLEFEIPKRSGNQAWNIMLAKVIVSAIYGVGLIGMAIPSTRPYFQSLTPFHLLMSLAFLLWFHRGWTKTFGVFVLLTFALGFGSEVLGVHTGFPFGNYRYGPVLGPQWMQVPLTIGVNWLLLVYMTGYLFLGRIRNHLLAAVAGAAMMVAIDVLIEPVAVALDFWSWENGLIPLQNYLGWFVISFLLQVVYRKMDFEKENALSSYILAHLIAFFAILNLIV